MANLTGEIPLLDTDNCKAINNMNNTTRKFKSWVDRWYRDSGTLICRDCEKDIVERWDIVLHDGKVLHIGCLELKYILAGDKPHA